MRHAGLRPDLAKESAALTRLKDRFIRFWPKLALPLVDLEGRFVKPHDRVLVVGSGRVPRVAGTDLVNIDLSPFAGVAVVGDVQSLCFADATFDVVVCHQVLEHVANADQGISEIRRVLRPGGRVLASVPFFFPFHAAPYDFRRWTIPGLKVSFAGFEEIESGIYNGPVCGVLACLRGFIGILIPNLYVSHAAMALAGYVFFIFRYLDYLAVRLPNAADLAASVYFVGAKP